MPEGDTIYKLALRMRPELEGARLDSVWMRDRAALRPLAGLCVTEVSPLGKHLLIGVGPERTAARFVLHVHLGMHGRWDRYRIGERWRRPRHQAVLRLESGGREWVCFRAMTAELLRAIDVPGHPALRRLGPRPARRAFRRGPHRRAGAPT